MRSASNTGCGQAKLREGFESLGAPASGNALRATWMAEMCNIRGDMLFSNADSLRP